MAKVSSVEKNKHRAKLVKKYWARREKYKAIVSDPNKPQMERFEASVKLAKLPRNSAAIRVRNRCELTGRSRGVYSKFRLSRTALRRLASMGLVPGLTKASW